MPAARISLAAPPRPNPIMRRNFKDPLGIVFDLTHTGWVGAVKDVVAKR